MVSGLSRNFGQLHQLIPERTYRVFITMLQAELHQGGIQTNMVQANTRVPGYSGKKRG